MLRRDPVKLAYDVAVPLQGEDNKLCPVIFLHGVTFSRKSWLNIPQMVADATNRKVYAVDARNHGESDWSNEFDHYVMAKDVENFMDKMNVPKAVIVGHSLGAKTGVILAFSKPGRVEKLVAEEIPWDFIPPADQRSLPGYLKVMRKSLCNVPKGCDLETAKEAIVKYITSHAVEEYAKWIAPEFRRVTLLLKMTEEGVVWQTNIDAIESASFKNPLLQKKLEGTYEGEALFIYGTKSVFKMDAKKDVIMKMFPKAILSPVENATHLVHLEFPEEFCRRVVEFINEE